MQVQKILASAAALSLMTTPLAAQANTRSTESAVSLAPIAGDASRIGSPVEASDEALGKIPLWVIALLIALGITIEELVTSKGIFK